MRTAGGAFAWGIKQRRAARMVAEDVLTDREIAQRCAINVATLERWKLLPEFMTRMGEIRADLAAAELAGGIADRQRRVAKLDCHLDGLEQVIAERAVDSRLRRAPGGATGYVVQQAKMIGLGKNARLVYEYVVDVPTVKEMRALMQQAAQELGQWTERRELTGKNGGPVHIDLSGLSDEELDALERARRKLDTRPGGDPG